jgi:ethanolamine ammonia-lyase small subunit
MSYAMQEPALPDVWARFRAATRARVGLPRSGDALPTADLLPLQAAHARAREAVHRVVDFDALASGIVGPVRRVHSAAVDRASYLCRPDLGRRLDPSSRALLAADHAASAWDAVLVIGDGLSSAAIADHALATLRACLARLQGWRLAPIILAEQARVALADDIGGLLNAEMSVILIGERPGLTVSNSLGLYLTWQPRPGRVDAERNCISNVHADGLSYDQAADKLTWLMRQAKRLQQTGFALKDDSESIRAIEEH